MTTRMSQKEYRQASTGQGTTVIAGTKALRSHTWSNQEIGLIHGEDLATLAYEQSDTLPKEFSSCETFLAHWRGLRRKLGAPASPVYAKTHGQVRGDETRPLGQQIKQAWDTSPGLRAEFADSFSAYCAFKRAENRGGIRAVVGRVTGPQSKARK